MFCEENVIYEEVESLNIEMKNPSTNPKEWTKCDYYQEKDMYICYCVIPLTGCDIIYLFSYTIKL